MACTVRVTRRPAGLLGRPARCNAPPTTATERRRAERWPGESGVGGAARHACTADVSAARSTSTCCRTWARSVGRAWASSAAHCNVRSQPPIHADTMAEPARRLQNPISACLPSCRRAAMSVSPPSAPLVAASSTGTPCVATLRAKATSATDPTAHTARALPLVLLCQKAALVGSVLCTCSSASAVASHMLPRPRCRVIHGRGACCTPLATTVWHSSAVTYPRKCPANALHAPRHAASGGLTSVV